MYYQYFLFLADSDEVPNPSGSGVQSAGSGGRADGVTEATSSDNTGPEQGNARNDDNGEEGNGADNSNVPGPSIAPALSRSRTCNPFPDNNSNLF